MKEIHFIIDSGNTFTKVAQFHGDKLLELTSLPANKSLDLPKEAKGLFCSVNRDEPINSHLINLSSIKEKIKISTNYENSIGIDRQVLIYDLQKKGSSKFSVIIDAGSFITVDFTKDNLHLGGYIFPGVKNFLNISWYFSPAVPLIISNLFLLVLVLTLFFSNRKYINFNAYSLLRNG